MTEKLLKQRVLRSAVLGLLVCGSNLFVERGWAKTRSRPAAQPPASNSPSTPRASRKVGFKNKISNVKTKGKVLFKKGKYLFIKGKELYQIGKMIYQARKSKAEKPLDDGDRTPDDPF